MSNNKTTIISEPGKQEIIIIREFDAPRDLVFQAYTDTNLYPRWLGPRNLTMKLEKLDARTGGSYRYISVDKDGKEYAFNGVYHYVRPPNLIIDTFEYENLPERGHAAIEKLMLEDLPGGRTKTIAKSIFIDQEDRDGMMASGMEEGLNESFERLDELLEELQGQQRKSA